MTSARTSELTEGLPPSAVAQFQILRQRFVAGLPARWQEIDHSDSNLTLQSALHRLAGSAGSYGFDSLGRLARHAESLARNEASTELHLALAALAHEVEQMQSGTPSIR